MGVGFTGGSDHGADVVLYASGLISGDFEDFLQLAAANSPNWWQLLVLVLVSGLVTMACVPLAKRLARRLNAIDEPSSRRINKVALPRLGGLAMFCGIICAIMVEFIGEACFGWPGFTHSVGTLSINYLVFMAGLAFITLLGAVDDIHSLHFLVKLAGQIVGAVIIALSGVLLSSIKNPVDDGFLIFPLWFAIPLTVAYLVIFENIINLIDGLDGLAAGVVAIVAAALLLIALTKGRIETALLAAVLIGACLGFLRYNFNPASIFMGDSGALLIGTLLGALSLIGVMRSPIIISMAVPLFIAGVPLFDSAWAFIRRVILHHPIGQPDTFHVHHMMIRQGFSQRRAVLLVYLWTFLLAGGGVLLSNLTGIPMLIIFLVLVIVSGAFLKQIDLLEPVLQHHYHKRKASKTDAGEPPPGEDGKENGASP
ncbi:MAG: undecaprenyl/decaprenyl-phosphate alpha-N-acetylglucosaminyl 1-phosphate transferase [Actinomycetia bacterium]|nr:undecaprenyl/decaprenyl-phosphate alpha-N-acetylglucosaminyl 1-phosphate transferase [Actinomycetes bacterium]